MSKTPRRDPMVFHLADLSVGHGCAIFFAGGSILLLQMPDIWPGAETLQDEDFFGDQS